MRHSTPQIVDKEDEVLFYGFTAFPPRIKDQASSVWWKWDLSESQSSLMHPPSPL